MPVRKKGGLGKGLDSLIRSKSPAPNSEDAAVKSDKKSGKEEKINSISEAKKEKKRKSDSTLKSKKVEITENNSNENNKNGIIDARNGNNNGNTESTENYGENVISEQFQNQSSQNQSVIQSEDKSVVKKEISDIKEVSTSNKGESVLIMKISAVEPNREQPRKSFREEGIEELASSIAQYGIIQPLLVQKKDDYYEIIAGERRWRAAMKAGLKEIPVIVKDYTNREAVEISLIENIQREDLNPIEEALAFDRLIQEFQMTQEQVAGRVSKSRSAVTNSLRLLKLEGEVREMVITGELSEGHARTLLGVPNNETQRLLAERIIKEKLSVRDTEKLVKKLTSTVPKKVRTRDLQKEAILNNLSEQLKIILGTKVSITEKGKSKGKIEIEFYSDEELNRIFEMLQSLR